MCFQGFATFRCGHKSIFNEECSYAKDLDLPFFLTVSCPNYNIATRQVEASCGIGKFYCGETHNGKQLDNIYEARKGAQIERASAETHKHVHLIPFHAKITARISDACGGDDVMITKMWQTDPEVRAMKESVASVKSKVDSLTASIEGAEKAIEGSRQFYELHIQNGTEPPALPDILRDLHNFMQPLQAKKMAQVYVAPSMTPWNGVPATFHVNGGTQGASRPRRLASLHDSVTTGPRPKLLEYYGETFKGQEILRKQGHTAKKAKADTPDEPVSQVRRSARAVKKKVNYAEAASDISRSPSPNKSDASSFAPSKSPSKSEASDAQVVAPRPASIRGERRRRPSDRRSSMREIILETQRYDGNSSNLMPLQQPPAVNTTANNTQTATYHDLDDSLVSIPDSTIQPMSSAYLHPTLTNPQSLSSIRQNWIVNRGDSDPTLTPNRALQSTNTMPLHSASPNDLQIRFRSSPSDFFPRPIPLSTAAQNPIPNPFLDPRKRSISASSPILPSSKKIRLSFPGQPRKTPFQDISPTRRISTSSPLRPRAENPPTNPFIPPAPILLPTPRRSKPKSVQQEQKLEGSPALPLSTLNFGPDSAGGGGGHPTSTTGFAISNDALNDGTVFDDGGNFANGDIFSDIDFGMMEETFEG